MPDTLPAQDTAATLRDIIVAVLKLDLPPGAIADDTNLHELGLESMSVVELLTEIEIAFDIVVDVEDLSVELFARFDTLRDFISAKRDGAPA